ncbi:MAG: dihydroorotate dehydrogenase electron transfer subunit [Methanomassiliicoccaceae archaeon]|nr:dihydroorotate dehydrogenase electron transfer subunit [Methanomassiliicoccaceae archaeon]
MSDVVRIISYRTESKDTKTFEFVWNKNVRTGQFVMIWIPGIDEIPMSVSSTKDVKSITVKAIGEATAAIHKLKEGDIMGIRGPYGNGFSINENERLLVVGGGVGVAAVMPAVRETGADMIIGAKSKDEIIMEQEARRHSKNVWVSTDDGTHGFKGNAVQLMKERITEKEYDMIIACGPEIMLYHIHKACDELNIKYQLSLERYMKCGIGLCGSCVMDGMRVCADGPVFRNEQIPMLKEFGRSKRDPSGIKIDL